ncbi:MAG: hypothetical protein GWO20_01660 [Candidatus Korarchaeota archaeon]|nr:hypothetical protein [Candidatus Korarchaeota archaeon]NIU82223.1 hypothetical protein [Candidatus Thorarchaeota archaeon]NIW12686.1 hypothetical protein [Candidatus Thorarchaeota archaeon]NIW50893.1 hypothetical protein [Candidatus Korarchaeota archaeon]
MITEKILDYASRHPVFRARHLETALGIPTRKLNKLLYYMEKKGDIERVMKGVYTVTDDEKVIATGVYHPSYISLYSALFIEGVFEQVPKRLHVVTSTVYGVRDLNYQDASIRFYKITPKLFFGYKWREENEFPYPLAIPEKAVLDTLYLGFTLDIGTLHWEDLDQTLVHQFVSLYPKSVKKKLNVYLSNCTK